MVETFEDVKKKIMDVVDGDKNSKEELSPEETQIFFEEAFKQYTTVDSNFITNYYEEKVDEFYYPDNVNGFLDSDANGDLRNNAGLLAGQTKVIFTPKKLTHYTLINSVDNSIDIKFNKIFGDFFNREASTLKERFTEFTESTKNTIILNKNELNHLLDYIVNPNYAVIMNNKHFSEILDLDKSVVSSFCFNSLKWNIDHNVTILNDYSDDYIYCYPKDIAFSIKSPITIIKKEQYDTVSRNTYYYLLLQFNYDLQLNKKDFRIFLIDTKK